MTLIELIAGLVVLGVMISTVLIARSRAIRQSAIAGQRVDAINAADRLLESWWSDLDHFPRSGVGQVAGKPDLRWSVSERPAESSLNGICTLVTLEIRDRKLPTAQPLARVELMMPIAADQSEDSNW